jgi:RNA polymerase II subunit A small phosphatase-like protein
VGGASFLDNSDGSSSLSKKNNRKHLKEKNQQQQQQQSQQEEATSTTPLPPPISTTPTPPPPIITDREELQAHEQPDTPESARPISLPTSPEGPAVWLLPPLTDQDKERKCLVLDLDETLVHSSFKVRFKYIYIYE